jgi:hypothetical protein
LQCEVDQLRRFEARRGATRKPDPLEIQTYHIGRQGGGGVEVDTSAERYGMIKCTTVFVQMVLQSVTGPVLLQLRRSFRAHLLTSRLFAP